MAEQPSRKRRFVRRVVLAVAIPVLLLLWYVGMWLAVSRAEHDGYIGSATAKSVRPAFVPLISYCAAELPASGLLRGAWWRVYAHKAIVGAEGEILGYTAPAGHLAPRRMTRREAIEAQDRAIYEFERREELMERFRQARGFP